MALRTLIMACALAFLPNFGMAQTWLAGGAEWRPFSYSDEQQNLQGIAVDITRQILEKAGIKTRFVSYPVNRLQAMLDKEQLDLSYAESKNWQAPEVTERYVFSVPYLKVREYLYFAKDHPARDRPVETLQNLTIGMVRGYSYPRLEPGFEAGRLMKLETSQDLALLELLQAGRVDAVAMVDDLYHYLIVTHQIDPNQFQRGGQLSEAPLAMMLNKKHAALLPAINQAILSLQSSGEVARIHDSYLPSRTALACHAPEPGC